MINVGGYTHGIQTGGEPGTMHAIFGRRAFFAHTTHPDGEVWWAANLMRPTEPTPPAWPRSGRRSGGPNSSRRSGLTTARPWPSSRRPIGSSPAGPPTTSPPCRTGTATA
ncbi:hypothetical protein ACFQYP_21090 [Nonomuraea antimicrobica]